MDASYNTLYCKSSHYFYNTWYTHRLRKEIASQLSLGLISAHAGDRFVLIEWLGLGDSLSFFIGKPHTAQRSVGDHRHLILLWNT